MKNNYLYFVLFALIETTFTTIRNENYYQNNDKYNQQNPSLKVQIRKDLFEKFKVEFCRDRLPFIINSIKPIDFECYGTLYAHLSNFKVENWKLNIRESNFTQISERLEIQFFTHLILEYVIIKYENNVTAIFESSQTNIDFSLKWNDKQQMVIVVEKVNFNKMNVKHVWVEGIMREFFDFIRNIFQDQFDKGFTTEGAKIIKKGAEYELNDLFKKLHSDIQIDETNQIYIDRRLKSFPIINKIDKSIQLEYNFWIYNENVEQKIFKQDLDFPSFTENQVDIIISQNYFNNALYTYFSLNKLNFIYNFEKLKDKIILNTNLFKSSIPAIIFNYGLNKPMLMNIIISKEPQIEISKKGISSCMELQLDLQIDQNDKQQNLVPVFSIEIEINLTAKAKFKQNTLQLEIINHDLKTFKRNKGQINTGTMFEISGPQIIRQLLDIIIPKFNNEFLSQVLDIQDIISVYYNIVNPIINYEEQFLQITGDIENNDQKQLQDKYQSQKQDYCQIQNIIK